MEKFTKFRDPGTGIAPFLPIASGNRTPLTILIELTLCIVRIPLLVVVLVLEVALVEGLGEICLRRIVPSVVGWMRWLFLRSILLLCGIWWVDEQLDGVSKAYGTLIKTNEDNATLLFHRKEEISSHATLLVHLTWCILRQSICLRKLC